METITERITRQLKGWQTEMTTDYRYGHQDTAAFHKLLLDDSKLGFGAILGLIGDKNIQSLL